MIDRHPHVVTVLDWNRQPWPWYAMEFLDGGSLAERGGELDVAHRLWTAYALADAVAHAHGRGVGHYDITPGNVRFAPTPDGTWDAPKLIDWAGSPEGGVRRHDARTITPRYASPEMRSPGDSDRIGVDSDVYQLGVVIYELLTGRLPERGDDRLSRPSEVADVPSAVDEPLRGALARDPRNRTYLRPFRDALRDAFLAAADRDGGADAAAGRPNARDGASVDPTGARADVDADDRPRDAATGAARERVEESVEPEPVVCPECGHREAASRPGDICPECKRGYVESVEDGTAGSATEASDLDPSADPNAWPMYRGGLARTGAAAAAVGPPDGVRPPWHAASGVSVASSPAVVDGTVYVGGDDGSLRALRADTGAEVWRYRTDSRIRSSPAVAGDTVVVGGTDQSVHAVDADTGEPRWTHDTGFWVLSSPAVTDGTVYVGSDDFSVYALDGADGGLLWEFRADGEASASSPAVVDGTVYVACDDGNVYALDADTGAETWRLETDFVMHTTPAVTDGQVYVGSSQNRLYALDAADGSVRWTFDTEGDVHASPAVAGDAVLFGSDDGRVYAADRATGEERWRFPANDWVRSSPTVAGETVYVGADTGSVYALDVSTGRPQWRHRVGDRVSASPAVADGTVYVGADTGIHALDSDGT
jgi:outer membrane protein assembly factor BamB